MRFGYLLPLLPLVVHAAPPVSLVDATSKLLEAFDYGLPPESLPRPLVSPKDRPALEWLRATLAEAHPANPFPKGSRSQREAEAVRALLIADSTNFASKLATLKPTLAGSHAALWRSGQTRARKGDFSAAQRHVWENLLAQPESPFVIRGLALRHALCFALAEGDESRLMTLKSDHGDEIPDFFQTFQRAFALLGGPAPRFYLWSLPELEPQDLSLSRLGPRVYLSPTELPAPSDAVWIIPAPTTNHPTNLSVLGGESLKEAIHLAQQVRTLGRKAFLAPSRPPLEALALVYFPIDIRLDAAGMIQSIRMGDAAQANPTP